MNKNPRHGTVPVFLIIIIVLCAPAALFAGRKCFHSGPDKTVVGKMLLSQIISAQQEELPDGRIYIDKRPDGDYWKVCSDPDQFEIMQQRIDTRYPNGSHWKLIAESKERDDVIQHLDEKIYRIMIISGKWKLWVRVPQ